MRTRHQIREIAKAGEKIDGEFKQDPLSAKQALSDGDIVDAVVCLANGPAGYTSGLILIGVRDDGIVTGARPRHGSSTSADRMREMIFSRTEPALETRVSVIGLDEGDVIVIDVPRPREGALALAERRGTAPGGSPGPLRDPAPEDRRAAVHALLDAVAPVAA